MHRRLFLLAAAAAAISFGGLTASAKTILLVPQDDRPVSLSYTVDTAEKAGYTVLTPPTYMLSGSDYQGAPDRVWSWVQENMNRADAAVISTDTLIYGGLVDSRKHNESIDILTARENRIRTLHQNFPNVPIYAFGTIMRTPYASSSGVEPYYYANYGPTIYRISALQDKMDLKTITPDESAELLSLKLSVPSEYLQDWFKRRTKNTIINKRLIADAQNHTFTYFCLGFDDSSKNSQSAMETRYLADDAKKISNKIYGSFPGADQLALLLIARYHVDANKMNPTFSVIYPLGRAEDTVPSYESQPIGQTIAQHITAVGGTIAKSGRPDILLAVNTPLASTGESGQFSNFGMLKQSTLDFMNQVKSAHDKGIPISMVDVYFANGSDNTLMKLMKKEDLLYSVAAYNGWNTASNTIGFSIAQAILAPSMTDAAHKDMLTVQYLDNWAYQANVRKNLYRLQEILKDDPSKAPSPAVKEEMIAEIQDFAKREIGLNPATVSADFPWGRLFEIEALVSPTPKYPVLLTRAEKQRIAEEKAKKEAEEKAKKEAAAKAAKAAGQPAPTADGPAAPAPSTSQDTQPAIPSPQPAAPTAETPTHQPAAPDTAASAADEGASEVTWVNNN